MCIRDSQLAMHGNYLNQSTCGPRERKQSRYPNNGGNVSPVRSEVNTPVTQGGVGIRAKVDSIVAIRNEPQQYEHTGPNCDTQDMQSEHEEDGPTEQEHSPDKVGSFAEKASTIAFVQDQNLSLIQISEPTRR